MDKSRVSRILALLLITALILPIFITSMMATVQMQNQLENVENQAIISSLNYAFSIQPVKAEGMVSPWMTQTVDSVGDVGIANSLAFDSSGNPAVSYYDYAKGDLRYAFQAFMVEMGPGLNQFVDASAQTGVELSLNLTAPASLRIARTMWNIGGSAPSSLDFLGRFVYIVVNDTTAIQGITITIHYTDQEVARKRLNETSLAIWYWNENSENWIELPSTVDTENNIITAWVNHLTLFAILGISASSVIPITLILLFLLFYMVQPYISFPIIDAGTILVVLVVVAVVAVSVIACRRGRRGRRWSEKYLEDVGIGDDYLGDIDEYGEIRRKWK
jgi:hypothetical protein